MSPTKTRTGKMEIDHRKISFPQGATVLRAAELADIYIPSLCAHKDLSPFGGCRMCMVEIEGMRGYPLACSTIAEEGMQVLTDTSTLREMRKEILQLILSEHPSSCMLCDETDNCEKNQYTIRKVGVTTGCRTCPNDSQCELHDVVEKVGITDIEYPITYRGYEVEHDDPFFDRDYNLCILCGRCVRMCQEVRGTSVLAFKHRGPKAQIGPAFAQNHMEAGCEFCGACVSVCPTGALAEKGSKWDGKPDGVEVSTCPFCSIGCQLELYHKNGKLSKAHPHLDPEVNDGQLCVRGRFSLPEATHHHTRATKPMLRKGAYFREVDWKEAADEVAARLKEAKPEDIMMVVSGDLTNESLYAARRFARDVLGTGNLASTASEALPGGRSLWSALFAQPIRMGAIRHADSIIAVGLNARFYFSVAGVEVLHAVKAGANLVTIDPRDSTLARAARQWLRCTPGAEGVLLGALAANLGQKTADAGGVSEAAGVDSTDLDRALTALSHGTNLAVVVGPGVFAQHDQQALLDALALLAKRDNTTILPLYHGTNARGALELGLLDEVKNQTMTLADLRAGTARPKVLFLVGETPITMAPDEAYVVAQGTYHPPFDVDAFLPAASFAEAAGTVTNIEGRVQQVVQIENPPDGAVTGFVRPDWQIFAQLAAALGHDGLTFTTAKSVLAAISKEVPGFPPEADRKPRTIKAVPKVKIEKREQAPAGSGRYLLVLEPGGFAHRGYDLSALVEGLSELGLEAGFRISPHDAVKLGAEPGDTLAVRAGDVSGTGPVIVDGECPDGVVYVYRPFAYGGLTHRTGMEPLYALDTCPIKVDMAVQSPRSGPEHNAGTVAQGLGRVRPLGYGG